MNNIKVIVFSCSLAMSAFSYSANASKGVEPNLSHNIREVVYHSSQLPKVIHDNQDIVMKLLRGEVVNPARGLFGVFVGGATSLLNGDMTKLIKLSGDLGPHIKAIQDNGLAIKDATEKSLPSALVNLISTAPQQMLDVTNTTLDYVANNAVERSQHYQQTQENVEKNTKEVAAQKTLIEKNQRETAHELKKVQQDTEKNRKAAESMQQELMSVRKNLAEQFEQQSTMAQETANQATQNAQAIETMDKNIHGLQQQYQQLQHSVQENRSMSSRGIASIAAMANIPVPAVQGKMTVGAGVGHFDTKTAVAVGIARYYENGATVKVSVGTAGAKLTVGGGMSYSF